MENNYGQNNYGQNNKAKTKKPSLIVRYRKGQTYQISAG